MKEVGKICKECGETKPLVDFYAWGRGTNQYITARCKPCHNHYINLKHKPRGILKEYNPADVKRTCQDILQDCGLTAERVRKSTHNLVKDDDHAGTAD